MLMTVAITNHNYYAASSFNGQLILPKERTTGRGCLPEGKTVSYRCTVEGTRTTVWIGSAFNCSTSDIILHHSLFTQPDGASGTCGGLTAMSVGVSGTEYTSRLTLTATTELRGEMINCTRGDETLIDYDIIRVGGLCSTLTTLIYLCILWHTVIPLSPGSLFLNFTSDTSFDVSWDPPSEGNFDQYVFGVTGEGCGCVSMNVSGDTTSVNCSGWTATGQTCSFEVRTLSQDCGFISDPVNETVSLTGQCSYVLTDVV